jgi:hypothetical protein
MALYVNKTRMKSPRGGFFTSSHACMVLIRCIEAHARDLLSARRWAIGSYSHLSTVWEVNSAPRYIQSGRATYLLYLSPQLFYV